MEETTVRRVVSVLRSEPRRVDYARRGGGAEVITMAVHGELVSPDGTAMSSIEYDPLLFSDGPLECLSTGYVATSCGSMEVHAPRTQGVIGS